MVKKIVAVILGMILLYSDVICFANEPETISVANITGDNLGLTSKAAILMEAETGRVIYELNADEILSPASITKIMTLILIFDNIKSGKISLDDEVTTSEYAKSMGGSQVFLEAGEKQTVDTLIKCIIVASGNDASVTMAEYISGSESEFIAQMNERAKQLGMKNTVFKDCCGLCDSMEHHTTARDVATMSRELITKYPEIENYTKIWMENITHVTDKGSKEFTLSNTNKLIKQYQFATGLKTGSTSLAKYCLSATARKGETNLIAVIMAAPDYKIRFSEAVTLLNFGFSSIEMYDDSSFTINEKVKVLGGIKDKITISPEKGFKYTCIGDEKSSMIKREIIINPKIKAPIKRGDKVGSINYYLNDSEIGTVNLISNENVKKSNFTDIFIKIYNGFML